MLEVSASRWIRVINLDRSPERLAEFKRTNLHLSCVERVRAVEGRSLDLQRLVKDGIMTPDLMGPDFYSAGALGLAMSHLGLWDLAIEKNCALTIAEDDAIFHHRFEEDSSRIMSDLPADWDFILWGFNWDLFTCFEMIPGVSSCLAQFEEGRMRRSVEAFQNQQLIMPQAFPLVWAFGTACYSISPKGARELKSRLLPLRPIVIPIPEARRAPPFSGHFRAVGIDNHMCSVHRHIKSFVCIPPLVVTKNDRSQSTIQGS